MAQGHTPVACSGKERMCPVACSMPARRLPLLPAPSFSAAQVLLLSRDVEFWASVARQERSPSSNRTPNPALHKQGQPWRPLCRCGHRYGITWPLRTQP